MSGMETFFVDGNSLTPEMLVTLASTRQFQLDLTPSAWEHVKKARAVIDDIVVSRRVVYGINTGFGNFQSIVISPEKLDQLQTNLIRSHCAGVGEPLAPHRARMLLVLRINILAKGYSGISPEALRTMIAAYNNGIVPYIPRQGTVGASGDLAPLSHLAQGLIGEGRLATLDNLAWRDASAVLKERCITPIRLQAKEGLAMINGTQFITSIGCEAVVRARRAARQADIVMAMSLEALEGTVRAMHPEIHRVRHHEGQIHAAARMRSVLSSAQFPSEVATGHGNTGRVQDAYSLRCAPQVHGVVGDVIEFVHGVLTREANCATDNPLIFANAKEEVDRVISGGNFHGEYPAKMCDILGLTVTELASISERRIERLNNPSLSRLPAFLIQEGGLNSGFMIAHCTAAALVSENKVLSHPASVDSISTSAAQEDHVSMGGFAARKLLKIIQNVEYVLAIELMCAVQGVEFHRPKKTTEPLERVVSIVRSVVPKWTQDRDVSTDIEAVARLLRDGAVWDAVSYAVPPEHHFNAATRAKL